MRTPRLRKLVADATALRRECAQERTLFYFIGNSDFWIRGKEALLIEHMLNQQGNGHDNRTMVRFRRYKNLLLQTNRQKGRLHS